jgi:phage anti-repressor protein
MDKSLTQFDQSSPFDAIKQIDNNGREYWSARDLQELLGYAKWQKFEDAIERAMIACKNSGQAQEDHFTGSGKMIKRGKGASHNEKDYHLTRYACYMIAMNGVPRKEEIAAAQTYFAIKTRQAETAQPPQQQYVNADFVLRLRLNAGRVPYDHWTVLEQIDKESHHSGLGLVALINKARPDISVGKKWSNYLKKNGHDTSQFMMVPNIVHPGNMHEEDVRAYSLDLLPLFLRWLHKEYQEHFEKCYLPGRKEQKRLA